MSQGAQSFLLQNVHFFSGLVDLLKLPQGEAWVAVVTSRRGGEDVMDVEACRSLLAMNNPVPESVVLGPPAP